MEDISILWLSWKLIVNQFGFNSLLWRYYQQSFHRTSDQATQEIVSLGLLSKNVGCSPLVSVETNWVFRHVENQKWGIAPVEAEEAVCSECFANNSECSQLLFCLIELHASLDILGRVGARNLNSANDTTYFDYRSTFLPIKPDSSGDTFASSFLAPGDIN